SPLTSTDAMPESRAVASAVITSANERSKQMGSARTEGAAKTIEIVAKAIHMTNVPLIISPPPPGDGSWEFRRAPPRRRPGGRADHRSKTETRCDIVHTAGRCARLPALPHAASVT